MLALRSHLYNVVFYLNLSVLLVFALATFAMPRKAGIIRMAQLWGRTSLWWLRTIVGTRVEYRGLDRIPPGPLLIAAKHQSFLETFALLPCVDDPAFILKQELQWIPVFGWLTIKAGMIPVRRGRSGALAELKRSAARVRRGRQVIIFPEGTRRAPGAEPAYRLGVAHLYESLEVPCIPVALNSGLFWPRRHYLRRPGTVVIEFGEPIPPGLEREAFMALLEERIETASDRLLAEGRRALDHG
jgi:1-acyl-sn-glycerol-3-phosphate acyltransferase